MFCKRCGKEIEDNARECPFCGTPTRESFPQSADRNVYYNDYSRQEFIPRRKNNGMAIAGFICSFFCILFGLIFSIIGARQCNEYGDDGLGLATVEIIISSLKIAFIVLIIMVVA